MEAVSTSVGLSVVVPVYNEEESLPHLHAAVVPELEALGRSWELIYVDDGSSDASFEVLRGLADADPRVRVIRFRRNFGQTAAMAAGFENAQGDVIVPMDADLQNDPKDIARLLEKIDEGYDVVSGWRAQRQDAFWTVTLPSRLGNAVIGRMTGVVLHDYGCTLTAYRREVLSEVRLYGEMHRFIPAWAAAVGARITELPVAHHARRWGQSKYNLRKAVRVLLDLLTVRFLLTYATKPQYFFGRLGLRVWGLAGLCWTWTLVKRLIWGEPLYTDPFFMTGIFLALAGLQILLFGLLAEMSMRTYYESQGKTIYVVRETVNLPAADPLDRRQRR
ncbi:MAG: glycosyltransferase family 2 protein [Deltaproteobacteria bacterium]|nr:glycosyltransferase family 2 protein [Deltaproteobacteria bacterium]MCB9786795.1 glycosyltransferase family 2 protein [Deltaproteobacteria bacterium]